MIAKATITKEAEKAYLVKTKVVKSRAHRPYQEECEIWLPKKHCKVINDKDMEISDWLANARAIVYSENDPTNKHFIENVVEKFAML